jgi:hypothetical protein
MVKERAPCGVLCRMSRSRRLAETTHIAPLFAGYFNLPEPFCAFGIHETRAAQLRYNAHLNLMVVFSSGFCSTMFHSNNYHGKQRAATFDRLPAAMVSYNPCSISDRSAPGPFHHSLQADW